MAMHPFVPHRIESAHAWLGAAALAFAGLLGCTAASERDVATPAEPAGSGPLATYLGSVMPLTTPCGFDSKLGSVTISMTPAETAVVSKRSVDGAILVQGEPCTDSGVTPAVSATASRVKKILVTADASGGSPADLSGTSEVVIFDISNGPYAAATASSYGVFVDLGGGNDEVNVLASAASDRFGCSIVDGRECLGLRSATSADIKVVPHPGDTFILDLGAGNDYFDKGSCTTRVSVFGGAGRDTFIAGTDTSVPGDVFHGGDDIDTISYATRVSGVSAFADGVTASGDGDGAAEQDSIGSDIENLTGTSGNDLLRAGADTTTRHILDGGAGNDTLVSCAAGSTTFVGGAGIDTVDYSARQAGVVVTMGDAKANDGEPGDYGNVGTDVENLVGSPHDDRITGSGKSNVIEAGLGNDTVDGGEGDDTFLASAGVDGGDTFTGGKGTDTVDYSARGQGVCVVLDGASYSGQCTFSMGNPAMNVDTGDRDSVAQDIEGVLGTLYEDHLVGNAAANVLLGLGGADWLEGRAGDDQLDANLYLSQGGNVCHPQSLTCIGVVSGTCDCVAAELTTDCSQSAVLDCGADPIDLAACALADTEQFVGCWKSQN